MFRRAYRCFLLSELRASNSKSLVFSNLCRLDVRFITGSVSSGRYTDKQQAKILQVLNDVTVEELTKYSVSKGQAMMLDHFRSENGKFHSLDQVLQVKTFGKHKLQKLCDSILSAHDPSVTNIDSKAGSMKTIRNKAVLLTPPVEESRRNNVVNAVGIHVGLDTISWANLERNGKLVAWDHCPLNQDLRKIHPTTMFEMIFNVRMKIPDSDIYVMEDAASGQSIQQQITSLSLQLFKSQMLATLHTLLNTTTCSLEDNNCSHLHSSSYFHRVFYLRSRSTARLFRTLIGTERVSAQTVVQEILEPSKVPTDYSSIVVDDDLKNNYSTKTSVEKEHLCQSLLLSMAFMDLIVNQNAQSIKSVTGR